VLGIALLVVTFAIIILVNRLSTIGSRVIQP
jgi:hypothetical protein